MNFLKLSLLSLAALVYTAQAHIGQEKLTLQDGSLFISCIEQEMGANPEEIEAIFVYKKGIEFAGTVFYTPEEQVEFNKANNNLTEAMFGKHESSAVEKYEAKLKKAIITCMNKTADNFRKKVNLQNK